MSVTKRITSEKKEKERWGGVELFLNILTAFLLAVAIEASSESLPKHMNVYNLLHFNEIATN